MFCGIKLFERVDSVRAVMVVTFVHNDVETDFPTEHRSVTMGAVIFGFNGPSKAIIGIKV